MIGNRYVVQDAQRESKTVSSRLIVVLVVVAALALVLGLRLAHLQVFKYRHFAMLSEDNRVRIEPVSPTRGIIFDRQGEILAQNLPVFSLEVIPEVVDDMDAMIASLRRIIDIGDEDLRAFHLAMKSARRSESVPLRLRLEDRERARFEVNRHLFPGVNVRAWLARHYPFGSVGAHVIGYVGRIDDRDLRRIDVNAYRGQSRIGKIGLERSYEDLLRGRVGYEHVETDVRGRRLQVLERRDPVPGQNLFLTIDIRLQKAAEEMLEGHKGAVVAIEPSTGFVLAMASAPRFDLNLFSSGTVDADAYLALSQSPDRPLFHRAISGQYPPGSTVKPFLGLAGLDRGLEHARSKAWCRGWLTLPGTNRRYRDWRAGGHGIVGVEEAIEQSCDVYFYVLAHSLGIDSMHEYLTDFGFGEPTGIRLGSEGSGLVPSREWKRRTHGQGWYPGETLITGIGQGFMLTTPLQLAAATATVANRGERLRPQLIHRIISAQKSGRAEFMQAQRLSPVRAYSDGDWDQIVEAMIGVMHDRRGTAYEVGIGFPWRVAGKTGTAQVYSIGQDEEYDEESIDKRLHDHALFVAFAPADDPKISVAVVIENGGSGGTVAAPIAAEVIRAWLSRPPPKESPSVTEESLPLASASASGDRDRFGSSPASSVLDDDDDRAIAGGARIPTP